MPFDMLLHLVQNTLMLLKICWGNIQGIETCRNSIRVLVYLLRYSPLLAQILLIERGLLLHGSLLTHTLLSKPGESFTP